MSTTVASPCPVDHTLPCEQESNIPDEGSTSAGTVSGN
jgi:hypothetical protein